MEIRPAEFFDPDRVSGSAGGYDRIVHTEGSRLLAAAASAKQIAKTLGCDERNARQWRSGQVIPSESRQDALQVAFGIPRSAWGETPRTPAKTAVDTPATQPEPLETVATPPAAPEPELGGATGFAALSPAVGYGRDVLAARDLVRSLQRELAERGDQLDLRTRIGMADKLTAALTRLGSKAADNLASVSKADLLESPSTLIVFDAIVKALESHPIALRVVAAALAEIRRDPAPLPG